MAVPRCEHAIVVDGYAILPDPTQTLDTPLSVSSASLLDNGQPRFALYFIFYH